MAVKMAAFAAKGTDEPICFIAIVLLTRFYMSRARLLGQQIERRRNRSPDAH